MDIQNKINNLEKLVSHLSKALNINKYLHYNKCLTFARVC